MGRIDAAKRKVGSRRVNLVSAPQNAVELLSGERTADREELHAVPLVGQMTRRQHDGAVERGLVQYGRLEHGRCRDEPATASLYASESFQAGFFHHLRGDTAVMPDGNPKCLPVHLRIVREIVGKGRRDTLDHLRGQCNLLVRGFNDRAAHIVPVLDAQKILEFQFFSLHTNAFPFCFTNILLLRRSAFASKSNSLLKIIAKVVRLRTTIKWGFVNSLFITHTSGQPPLQPPKHCCDAILWSTFYAHYVDKFDLLERIYS